MMNKEKIYEVGGWGGGGVYLDYCDVIEIWIFILGL